MYGNSGTIGGMPPMSMTVPAHQSQQMSYPAYNPMGAQPNAAYNGMASGYAPGPQPVYQQPSIGQQGPDFAQISTHTNNKDPTMVKARVFVGNLNTFRVDRNDVIKLFQKFGNILGVNVCKGFAFIQFSTPLEAEVCVKTMKGYNWEGSELDIKLAFTDAPKLKKTQNQPVTNGNSANGNGNQNSGGDLPQYSLASTDIFGANRKFCINGEFEPKDLKKHESGAYDDVLLCGECHFRTFSVEAFMDHKKKECQVDAEIPKEPQVIQCFTCEDQFPSSWNLLRHMVTRHNLNLYRLPNDDSDAEVRGPSTPKTPLSENDNDNQNNEQSNGEETQDMAFEAESNEPQIKEEIEDQ